MTLSQYIFKLTDDSLETRDKTWCRIYYIFKDAIDYTEDRVFKNVYER